MRKLLLFTLLIGSIFSFSSCYQDPDYGVGIVTVLDANDFRVASAEVVLSQPGQNGQGIILVQGYTDPNGEFKYTHEPPQTDLATEVILNVSVQKDNAIGAGIIRIKPNEVATVTVRIY
ncbi:MAG: hypothetical protein IAE67_05885 [Candidatus Competibacteraceae bacterium]|nr:hypothetical protein [Candidatus Competibacteraceae bacterium]